MQNEQKYLIYLLYLVHPIIGRTSQDFDNFRALPQQTWKCRVSTYLNKYSKYLMYSDHTINTDLQYYFA